MSNSTTAAPAPSGSTGATGTSVPDDRATEFRAVEGGPEMRSGGQLLVTAYALIWLFLLAWLVIVWRKQNSLNGRLRDLELALDQKENDAAKASSKESR